MISHSEIKRSISNRPIFWLKIVVTSCLCTYILLNADWNIIQIAIRNANTMLILIVFLGMFSTIGVSALKWQILLNIQGIHYRLGKLTVYYLSATFFNNFLPGTIGGDGYRIYRTLKNPNSKAGAVISVLTERVFGFMALLFLGLFGAIGSFIQQGDDVSLFGIIFGAVGLFIFIIIVGLLSHKQIQAWVQQKIWMPQKIKTFVEHIDDYRNHPRQFLKFIATSLFFYILLFFFRLLLIRALGESCPISSLAMIVMVSATVATLPISLNGIGILDGSFIYLLSKFGVTYESALMVMVLHRMFLIALSLIGGILYYLDRDQREPVSKLKEGVKPIKESTL
jgi:uncharacterized protein (TIRG00374 family)